MSSCLQEQRRWPLQPHLLLECDDQPFKHQWSLSRPEGSNWLLLWLPGWAEDQIQCCCSFSIWWEAYVWQSIYELKTCRGKLATWKQRLLSEASPRNVLQINYFVQFFSFLQAADGHGWTSLMASWLSPLPPIRFFPSMSSLQTVSARSRAVV